MILKTRYETHERQINASQLTIRKQICHHPLLTILDSRRTELKIAAAQCESLAVLSLLRKEE